MFFGGGKFLQRKKKQNNKMLFLQFHKGYEGGDIADKNTKLVSCNFCVQ